MAFEFLLKVVFTLFSAYAAIMDYKTGEVPRIAFIAVFPVIFILEFLSNRGIFFVFSISGMAVGLAVFLLAYFLSKKKLGLADVWYSGISGFVLGPFWWHAAAFTACVMGILYMIISKKTKIPFIPLMAISGITMNMAEGKIH